MTPLNKPCPLSPAAWLRFDLIRAATARYPGAESIVEIGCGQGALAPWLARRYEYQGYEPDSQSYEIAARRLALAGSGSVANTVIPDRPTKLADIVCAFEVLEHLEDDAAALRAWSDWISPGGLLIVSVPAHPHRFGPADRAVGHWRRYSREELTRLMTEVGLADVEVRAYGFPLGILLESVRNRLAARQAQLSRQDSTSRSGRFLQLPQWASVLSAIAVAPFRLIQIPFSRTTFGTGWVASGLKP